MQVLVVASTSEYSSDGALLLARAFERQGCQVRFLSVQDDLPFGSTVAFAHQKRYDSAYLEYCNRYLLRQAARLRADVVFIYGSNWFILPETIKKLQQKHKCQVVIWELNHFLWRAHQAECIRLYDHFFALDSYMVPVLRVAGARRVHHLCACADPEEHYPAQLSPEERSRYESEVCFIGSAHIERAKMLSQLVRYNLRIYGIKWDKVDPALARYVCQEPVYGLKKTKVYSATRISINVHGPHMLHGENFRVFEVAACGAVSFSTHKPDLVRCFEPDKEVVLFENTADLGSKVDYFLAHPDELDGIGAAARQRVLAEHTYDHRAKAVLECIEGG